MGTVVRLFPSRHILLILVAGEQQCHSALDYQQVAVNRAKKLEYLIDIALLSDASECDAFVRCIYSGKYRQVWCYGEYANAYALRLCEVAQAIKLPVINSAFPFSVAYQAYSVFETDRKSSQKHRTL